MKFNTIKIVRKQRPNPFVDHFNKLWKEAERKITATRGHDERDELLKLAFGLAYSWFSLEGYKHIREGVSGGDGCKACWRAEQILEAAGVVVEKGPRFIHSPLTLPRKGASNKA